MENIGYHKQKGEGNMLKLKTIHLDNGQVLVTAEKDLKAVLLKALEDRVEIDDIDETIECVDVFDTPYILIESCVRIR